MNSFSKMTPTKLCCYTGHDYSGPPT